MPPEQITIEQLKQIKRLSDIKQYAAKQAKLLALMRGNPDAFDLDSDTGREFGITHTPTGFRFHLPKKHVLKAGVRKEEPEKVASDASLNAQLTAAGKKVNKNPSPEQAEAGNYKMGHVTVQGLDITIENPKGSTRTGVDKDGNKWSTRMTKAHYGYIRGLHEKKAIWEREASAVQSMASNEAPLRPKDAPAVRGLRWAGYNCLCKVGGIQKLLRGYGTKTGRHVVGQNRQRRQLHTEQLPMGDAVTAGAQQTKHALDNSQRAHEVFGHVVRGDRYQLTHIKSAASAGLVGRRGFNDANRPDGEGRKNDNTRRKDAEYKKVGTGDRSAGTSTTAQDRSRLDHGGCTKLTDKCATPQTDNLSGKKRSGINASTQTRAHTKQSETETRKGVVSKPCAGDAVTVIHPEAKDGDHVDVFIGSHPSSNAVFVIDQVDPATGDFDEFKCMLGFNTKAEARKVYMANYNAGWKGLSACTELSIDDFKVWLGSGDMLNPIAAQFEKDAAKKRTTSVAVDFDGTLATYDTWKGKGVLGEPIPRMVNRVKRWLKAGKTVKIFTARVFDDPDKVAEKAIKKWCKKHLGQTLEVTNIKDNLMEAIWDDRAVGVVKNKGTQIKAAGLKPNVLVATLRAGLAVHTKRASAIEKVAMVITGPDGTQRAKLKVEIADTPEKRAEGLGGRGGLAPAHGMFFDTAGAYWMKNVSFPLDIAFLDKQGEILEIQNMPVEQNVRTIYRSTSKEAAHALELAAGWANTTGIAVGDTVQVPSW